MYNVEVETFKLHNSPSGSLLVHNTSVKKGMPLVLWTSAEYGRQDASPVLVYSTVSKGPLRIMTLLLPTSDPRGAAPSVAPLVGEDSLPVGLVVERERVHFDGVGAFRVRAVSSAVGRRE